MGSHRPLRLVSLFRCICGTEIWSRRRHRFRGHLRHVEEGSENGAVMRALFWGRGFAKVRRLVSKQSKPAWAKTGQRFVCFFSLNCRGFVIVRGEPAADATLIQPHFDIFTRAFSVDVIEVFVLGGEWQVGCLIFYVLVFCCRACCCCRGAQ